MICGQGVHITLYIFSDGQPNGGHRAIQEIVRIVKHRIEPSQNPITFLSCTNEDKQVKWMKDCEEIAPYCAKLDDYGDKSREVLGDQGIALPYTSGFWLISQLVAAMNPDDLDAMDKSVPLTKTTLDNLLGIRHNKESYRYHFGCFVKNQQQQTIEIDPQTDAAKQSNVLKKNTQWHYHEFLTKPVAKHSTSPTILISNGIIRDGWLGLVRLHCYSTYHYFLLLINYY